MCQVQKFARDAGSCLVDTIPLLVPRKVTVFQAPGAQQHLASPSWLMEEGFPCAWVSRLTFVREVCGVREEAVCAKA